MKKIGLTTTVPIEVLIAAGYTPIDLNNLFVTSQEYLGYIELAEKEGFPKSMCAWIKGIYGACMKHGIREVVGVVEGDCSNTKALLEVMQEKGILIHPFGFPREHTLGSLEASIKEFMAHFGVEEKVVEEKRTYLNDIRKKAIEVDILTYEAGKATGFENHILQLCMSDFEGNPKAYNQLVSEKIDAIERRCRNEKGLRLAYLGVPPMTGDLYEFVETMDARIVYNEVQREFAFPRFGKAKNIYEQYYDYTYPYDLDFRIEEIDKQIKEREIDGVIHYTQAFCHKAIEDIVLRKRLHVPILTIEGDKQTSIDARTRLRLEAFIEMVHEMGAMR